MIDQQAPDGGRGPSTPDGANCSPRSLGNGESRRPPEIQIRRDSLILLPKFAQGPTSFPRGQAPARPAGQGQQKSDTP
eukprot:2684394-Alexandrium_andersonii.AAC.1